MLEFVCDIPDSVRRDFPYREAADAVRDPRGVTVRWAPWRRTVMHRRDAEGAVFCKHREGRWGDTRREWQTLHALAALGLRVPAPLFLARDGASSVLGMAQVPGHPLDAAFARGEVGDEALRWMSSVLRKLHGSGWVYRDMYWNHVFADPADGGIWLVDVERAFQPRWRFERWLVKDLAGLVSSMPSRAMPRRTAQLRFLHDALGDRSADARRLVPRILTKAARIRGHTTRYPG